MAKISLPNTMHWSVFSLQICSPKSLKQIRCTIFRMSFVLFIWFGSVQTEIRFIFRGSPQTLFLPLLCNPDEGTSPAYTHLHQDTHIVIEMHINEITVSFNLNAEIWWWVGSIHYTFKKIWIQLTSKEKIIGGPNHFWPANPTLLCLYWKEYWVSHCLSHHTETH